MEVVCTLVFEYGSEKEARKVLRSVELENKGYVEARISGKRIISDIRAKSPDSLRHTLDDYLACVSVAEKIVTG